MTSELWTVLSAQEKNCVALVERVLGYELQEAERAALPLFPDLAAFEAGLTVKELRSMLAADHMHVRSARITATLKKAVVAGAELSLSVQVNCLMLWRHAFAIPRERGVAREGFGLMVIAELLDHSDIQNVDVYTKNVPEDAYALNKAMALQLAPYAQAFQGVLVDSEDDAKAWWRLVKSN